MDLRWIFLFHDVETCVETCVETVVDLRWNFLRTFSSVKTNVFGSIFFTANRIFFHRKFTPVFTANSPQFSPLIHRLFSPLFHDTLRSLFHELGIMV